MGLILRGLAAAMKGALGAVFPPQCLSCGEGVAADGALCPACWREAEFIGASACARCGVPVPGDAPQSEDEAAALVCDDCLMRDRPWRHGRAALVYGGTGRALVLALKHGDRPDLAPPLGRWLAAAAAPLVRPGMLVVPVPLHPRRMLRRKYNQAALLAAQVARTHGLTHRPALLQRTRHTEMQDHRGVADRFANVAGALRVAPRHTAAVLGRAVLLVDDVMASGATAAAAAEALIAAGSGPVSVAVLARAQRKDRPSAGDDPE
ncbi:double zinc ribbon domain-containing protein [Paracoccus endophyticus]|uniref:double zinc ribbon domain-containing protein n=1 Tax=Paracoccus endophyticus TaxID=2233774 RepID=UPI001F0C6B03|nr:double zinc ribbon domain-containing protein [Paracoccus endophyticus]